MFAVYEDACGSDGNDQERLVLPDLRDRVKCEFRTRND